MSNNSKLPPTAEDGSAAPHFLGTRIRGLRKRRGMTLTELAQQSELTAGYISQLERNLSYPSIPALFNIARSLTGANRPLIRRFAEQQTTLHADLVI